MTIFPTDDGRFMVSFRTGSGQSRAMNVGYSDRAENVFPDGYKRLQGEPPEPEQIDLDDLA